MFFPRRLTPLLIAGLALLLPPVIAQAAPNTGMVDIACGSFAQVNDGAFGLPGPFDGEESFETLSFNGQLYLGMEADSTQGARLWRTRPGVAIPQSQADWEEVAADANGLPFGQPSVAQNDHIDSLATFGGYLYASTANAGSNLLGTRVFRSLSGDPNSWEDAVSNLGPGFGNTSNINFKDMQIFDGQLCGGTQNWSTGAQVWCTADGNNWAQKNIGGFGVSNPLITNVEVWSGAVFTNALYFGVQNLGPSRTNQNDDVAKLYRTTDLDGSPVWSEVFSGEIGSKRADLIGEFDGYLYLAVQSPTGIKVYRSSSGDAGSWAWVNTPGMDGDPANASILVDGAAAYNGALYIAVSNPAGFELWRTKGSLQPDLRVDWTQVGGSGLTDAANSLAELVVFNGYLYAWATNYTSGQSVLAAECAYEQTLTISGAGAYTFEPEIGAAIEFIALGQPAVTAVTVRAFPGAWDTQGVTVNGVTPVQRHYEISADGNGFLASLTLRYTDAEFAASGIASETSAYQAQWTGSEWAACQGVNTTANPTENTVTCGGVTSFSTLEISGQAIQEPTALTLLGLAGDSPLNDVGWLVALAALLLLSGILLLRLALRWSLAIQSRN